MNKKFNQLLKDGKFDKSFLDLLFNNELLEKDSEYFDIINKLPIPKLYKSIRQRIADGVFDDVIKEAMYEFIEKKEMTKDSKYYRIFCIIQKKLPKSVVDKYSNMFANIEDEYEKKAAELPESWSRHIHLVQTELNNLDNLGYSPYELLCCE
jgi:hypothetical protein